MVDLPYEISVRYIAIGIYLTESPRRCGPSCRATGGRGLRTFSLPNPKDPLETLRVGQRKR